MINILPTVKSYFASNFNTVLSVVNSEYSLTTPEPKYLDTEENVTNQLPSIEIFGDVTQTNYGDEEAPLMEGFEDHIVVIEMAITGSKRNEITMGILAYRETIKRLIVNDDSFGGVFHRVRLGTTEYSGMWQMKDNKTFLKTCKQTIIVRQVY